MTNPAFFGSSGMFTSAFPSVSTSAMLPVRPACLNAIANLLKNQFQAQFALNVPTTSPSVNAKIVKPTLGTIFPHARLTRSDAIICESESLSVVLADTNHARGRLVDSIYVCPVMMDDVSFSHPDPSPKSRTVVPRFIG